jgi:hypothetical protein
MLIERAVQQSTIPNRPVNWWNPVRKALVLTVALRLFYSLAAAAYSPFLRIDPNQIRVTGFPETLMSRDLHPVLYALIGVWQRWDTVWYLQIASHGYAGAAQTVFYPLFPVLIRIFGWVLNSDLAAAVSVSTAATFFMFWGALLLFELDLDSATALRALIIWVALPDAFIFFAGYPDSLLLALILWSLYFARTARWRRAAALGFLAGLTKALGCMLTLPLAWIAWRRRHWGLLAASLACPAGMGLFQLYLSLNHVPPPAMIYEKYWGTSTVVPWRTAADVVWFLGHGANLLSFFNCSALLLVTCGTFMRRLRAEYHVFAIAAVALLLTKHTEPLLQSTMRYSLSVFPAFPAIATRCRWGLTFAGLMFIAFGLNILMLKVLLDWGLVV